MNDTDPEICPHCHKRGIAPHPQNARQEQVDTEMYEKIVKPLEQRGFKGYFGSRDIAGGEHVIQALSKPMTIIPTTIVPVYKDRTFSELQKFLIPPNDLDRIVFLCFNASRIESPAVSRNSISFSVQDPYLLPKLIKTIEIKCSLIPLSDRKKKCEMSTMSSNHSSTISSDIPHLHRSNVFRRSDTSRVSFRIRPPSKSVISEEPSSAACVEVRSSDGNFLIEITSSLMSPDELLSRCFSTNENSRNLAAKCLTKLIQKNIINFCSDDRLHFQTLEKQTRSLIEKYDSTIYRKLYFWFLVAVYFRIYKCNDLKWKKYMKNLTLTECEIRRNPLDQQCQVYLNLAASLHDKIKAWPNRLDYNKLYVKKFENCLAMIDVQSLDNERRPPDALIKNLTNLPWDMKHIVIVAIAEKLFQKNYRTSSVFFFSELCDVIGRKHWGIFLDVLERLTEYMLENYTEGSLGPCMKQLHSIIIWNLQRRRRKNDHLSTVLKRVLTKLVYHPSHHVRHFVTPLILGKDFKSFDTSRLGNCYVKVDESLVEICIREQMRHHCPNLIINDEVPTNCLHASIYKARTPEGDALFYVFKQRTLNDILQSNSTDEAYERFCEISRLIQACPVHENIVAVRTMPRSSVLSFFVVENGKPLLQFLHSKENQLSWFQMIQILIDITAAVHHCHSHKIILCDITPASFIIVFREDGSFHVKLASFLHARSGECEDSSSSDADYTEDIDFLCIQGDRKEHIATYFSSPESLVDKTFSKYTEVWMLAATFYSVLLYGRQPFEELAHLHIFNFVKEISSQHTARMPASIPPDLWNIVKKNLDFSVRNRTLTETVLQELKTYQKNLGARSHAFYTVTTVCSYINPEDILRGYVDDAGNLILEETVEPSEEDAVDSEKLDGRLIQTVTVRMSLKTRRKILQLNHKNILKINEIKTDLYKTILVSDVFSLHECALSGNNQDISSEQHFSYFKQMTLGLQELHKHNIVHCDLRCSHIYIDPYKGTLKIGHLGRAVYLNDISKYAIKLMPTDAKTWSAPEVRDKGMYSKDSDVYNLAAVFREAIGLQINTNYQNQQQNQFQNSNMHLEEYCHSVNIQDQSEDSVNELLKCMMQCGNPNPTKRPSLDTILDAINNILTEYAQRCSTSGDTPEYDWPADTEDEAISEDFYETISKASNDYFSIDYAWNRVVNEFAVSNGLPNLTKPATKFIETSLYDEVGVLLKKKTQSKSRRTL